jgi:Immune inhibitor A-like, MAM domain
MRRMALAIAAVVAIALVPVVTFATPRSAGAAGGSDVKLDTKIHGKFALSDQAKREARAALASAPRPNAPPAVGEQRIWLGYDDVHGLLLVKLFTLRGVGTNSEVWVASDSDDVSSGTDFPAGDCRNDGVRNVVSDAQVDYLIGQFDSNMYPKESAAFSVAPSLDGSGAPLIQILRDAGLDVPNDYYQGPGDRVVVLVDNVRDENFFDTDNANGFSYIAGFYTSTFDFLFNRQAMTIDAFDWLHRTGASPPNNPVPNDNCLSAPARPFLYEGVFAHEYQHLLENYVDADETTWVNEGLSDHAGQITGYFDSSAPISDSRFDSHIQCFLGFLNQLTPANPNPRDGGPENSLTLWGDQTDFESEVLCDYGAAFSFMEYLAGQFGAEFMRNLHLGTENGLDSLAALLNGSGLTPQDVIENWATMVAVDAALGDGFSLIGGDAGDFSTPTLDASINWDNDQAFAGPGVPPNGSDYIRLRDATDAYLGVGDVESVEFNGASKLAKLPVEWTVDNSPPKGSKKALYSGKGDNLDRAIVQKVKVKHGKLKVDTAWSTEEGYDYAYVQVSTNGGKKYKSVHCTDSIAAPLGPGFEGISGGGNKPKFVTENCSLKKYAGKRVLLAFRYVTDPGVQLKGFWVDDVTLDGNLISDGKSLQGWKSPTQIHPVDVKAWFVRLVAIDETTNQVRIGEIPLDANFDGSLSGADLDAIIGTTGSTVSAIVTFLDRSETVFQTAPYTLTVNGFAQPGG